MTKTIKENPTKDKLRALTLGRTQKFRFKNFNYLPPILEDIKDDDGDIIGSEVTGFDSDNPITVQVRQPNVKERNKIIMLCKDKDGKLDEMEFIIQAAIKFTYDPESGERLYSERDYGALVESPAGDFLDQFGEEAIKLLTLGPQSGNG